MNFQELQQWKQQAQVNSQLRGRQVKTRITVGMGTCGIKAGAGDVLKTIEDELHRLGIADVVVAHVGCNGLCSKEPLVEVILPGKPAIMYGTVNPAKSREIVRRHIQSGEIIKNWTVAVREK